MNTLNCPALAELLRGIDKVECVTQNLNDVSRGQVMSAEGFLVCGSADKRAAGLRVPVSGKSFARCRWQSLPGASLAAGLYAIEQQLRRARRFRVSARWRII